MADYDYEIIVGMITVVDPTYYDVQKNTKTTILPVEYDSIPSSRGLWMELTDALENAGIKNSTCHFDKICCEEARYYFGKNNTRDKIQNLRNCVENYHESEHTFYCPFCGKKLHFVWKNFGTFTMRKVIKEMCTIKFEKVV